MPSHTNLAATRRKSVTITRSTMEQTVTEETRPFIQDVPGGKVNILGSHSIGHSKQKTLYKHVSYSERFPR
jgi:hypothetical protein